MTPEDDWLRTIARQNEAMERARRIQPGRGHRPPRAWPLDWIVLAVVLISLIVGVFW